MFPLRQQTQPTARVLVGLSEHRLRRLRQHVAFGVIRHGFCHIRVANCAFASFCVFVCRREVRGGVEETIYRRTDGCRLVEFVINRRVDFADGVRRVFAGSDRRIGKTHGAGVHIFDVNVYRLVGTCAVVNGHGLRKSLVGRHGFYRRGCCRHVVNIRGNVLGNIFGYVVFLRQICVCGGGCRRAIISDRGDFVAVGYGRDGCVAAVTCFVVGGGVFVPVPSQIYC